MVQFTAGAEQRPPRVFAIVLAGGEGKRLSPLTRDRAKPAVPFGGVYRLIDFAFSNLVNGEYRRIAVLTQYKSHSPDRHVSQTRRLSPQLGNYVTSVPAQMRRGRHWFSGSGDAIYQNFNLLSDEQPDYVLVFGADHIYHMDPRQMVAQHIASGAGVTVAAIRAPRAQAKELGVIEASGDRIVAFHEKPDSPPTPADDPESVYASMGNYVFTAKVLIETLTTDAADDSSAHDLGGDIIPTLVRCGEAAVYDFQRNIVPGAADGDRGYWRDVGTLDSLLQELSYGETAATSQTSGMHPLHQRCSSRRNKRQRPAQRAPTGPSATTPRSAPLASGIGVISMTKRLWVAT
jgi:glucose-1-phosphate adenylyltransferase